MNISERNEQLEPDVPAEMMAIEPLPARPNRLVHKLWLRLPYKYRQNFEPEVLERGINLLSDEEKQLEIRLAWYREVVSKIMLGYFKWLLLFTVLLTIGTFILTRNTFYTTLPSLIFLFFLLEGIREYIEYHQWRLVKTNKRLIISLPQKNSWPLVDNIEMGDLPKIIDTNWSNNWFWKIMQFFTGARDIHLSLTAFQFDVNSARVKDALIIPDIMPADIQMLKELVFSKK